MTEQLKANPLYVFATEVIHGAYKPEELKDAAMRAIRHHSAQPAQAVPVLTDAEIHAADPIPQNRFDQERVEFARRVEQAVRAKMGVAGW